jgi:DUF971 family protein
MFSVPRLRRLIIFQSPVCAGSVRKPENARFVNRAEQEKLQFSPGGAIYTAMPQPATAIEDLQLIGEEVAIRWSDGLETYFPMELLRVASPSAENTGEKDLFGNMIGGGLGKASYPGVLVTDWLPVGGYGVQLHFSDGHRTGIYSYGYLRELWEMMQRPNAD